jgi:hypothetical protein
MYRSKGAVLVLLLALTTIIMKVNKFSIIVISYLRDKYFSSLYLATFLRQIIKIIIISFRSHRLLVGRHYGYDKSEKEVLIM